MGLCRHGTSLRGVSAVVIIISLIWFVLSPGIKKDFTLLLKYCNLLWQKPI